MNRIHFYVFLKAICLLLLVGCESNSLKLVAKIPDANNLPTPCTVYLNGVDVGVLDNLRVGNHGQLFGDLKLTKVNSLPSDSELVINSQLLGGKSLQIKTGISASILSPGDTVFCHEVNANAIKAEAANPFSDFIKIPQKQDSILKELQRLNQNIEKVLKEKQSK